MGRSGKRPVVQLGPKHRLRGSKKNNNVFQKCMVTENVTFSLRVMSLALAR